LTALVATLVWESMLVCVC